MWIWAGPSTGSGCGPFDPFDRLRAGCSGCGPFEGLGKWWWRGPGVRAVFSAVWVCSGEVPPQGSGNRVVLVAEWALRPVRPVRQAHGGQAQVRRDWDGGEVRPVESGGTVPPSFPARWLLEVGPIGGLQAAFWHTGDMVPGAVRGEFPRILRGR